MLKYEYKIVPAPVEQTTSWFARAKGDGFENTVTELMNALGECGWDYIRSETLTTRRRRFLRAAAVSRHEVLVFRRSIGDVTAAEDKARIVLSEPEVITKVSPRRVRDLDAVRRVKSGERRIELVSDAMAMSRAN